MNDDRLYERYQRQVILRGFGEESQQKLLDAKVLVIGAGGLGCPALQYLAAAGVGTIGIVDDDIVSLSNLHRQPLYSMNDIGLPKVTVASEKLKQLNPDVKLVSCNERITVANALSLLHTYDWILDGSDNFATRYLVNDACMLLKKPLIYAAVSQYEGQVAVFNCNTNGLEDAVNYRDLFPHPPHDGEIKNCEEAGVLGVLPGIIGTMMAAETIKLITGIGTALINRLFTFNILNNQSYEFTVTAREETKQLIPPDENAFGQMNYEWLCSGTAKQFEIDADFFNEFLVSGEAIIVDVRESNEAPVIKGFPHLSIPMKELANRTGDIKKDTVVLFCQSGKRSLKAAEQLSVIFGESKKIYSLKGGIVNWLWKNEKVEL